MKSVLVIVSCFMVSSCVVHSKVSVAPPPASSDFSTKQVSEIAEFILHKLDRPLPEGWTIVIVDHYISIYRDNPEERCFVNSALDTEQKQLLLFPFQNCVADSALPFELAHLVGYPGNRDTGIMINKIYMEVVEKFCPSGYVPGPPPYPTLKDYSREPILQPVWMK